MIRGARRRRAATALALFLLPGCALIVDLNKSYEGPDDASIPDATTPRGDGPDVTPPRDAASADGSVPLDAPDSAPPPLPPPSPFAIPCDPGDGGDAGGWHLDCTFGTGATFVFLGDAATPPQIATDDMHAALYGGTTSADPTAPTMTLVRAATDGGFLSLFAGVPGSVVGIATAPGALVEVTEVGLIGNAANSDAGTTPTGAFIATDGVGVSGETTRALTVDGGDGATVRGFIGALENTDPARVDVAFDLYLSANVETVSGVVPAYLQAPVGLTDNPATAPSVHSFARDASADGAAGEWLASSETGTLVDGGLWIAGPSTIPGRGAALLVDPAANDTVLGLTTTPFPIADMFTLLYRDYALGVGAADASVGLVVLTREAVADGGIDYFSLPFTPTTAHMTSADGVLVIATADASGNVAVRKLQITSGARTTADTTFGDAGILSIPIGYPSEVGGILLVGGDIYVGLLVHTPNATPAILVRLRE